MQKNMYTRLSGSFAESLRRVVEGHIEERLTASFKEMRLEVGSASDMMRVPLESPGSTCIRHSVPTVANVEDIRGSKQWMG